MSQSPTTLQKNDINKKTFPKSLLGFNINKVTQFLYKISFDYHKLEKQNQYLQQKIEELEQELAKFKKIEESLHETLIVARQTAEESLKKSKEDAQKEIKKMFQDAESKYEKHIQLYDNLCHDIENLLAFKKQIYQDLNDVFSEAQHWIQRSQQENEKKYEWLSQKQQQYSTTPSDQSKQDNQTKS